jgi:hypothetical protein
MRVRRKLGALPGLEVHIVRPGREAVLARQRVGFVQHADRDAEGFVALLRAGNRLEDQPDGRAGLQALHLRGDVGQHAVLRRDVPRLDHVVGHVEQPRHRAVRVVHRVDADHRVAGAVGQAFVNLGADAFGRVGRVVGLVAAGEASRQPDRVVAMCALTRSLLAP